MPIYEYLCEDCGTKFEKLVLRASDKEELVCPSCGKSRLEQQLSTFAPHAGAGSSQQSMPQCPSSGCCPRGGMCGMN